MLERAEQRFSRAPRLEQMAGCLGACGLCEQVYGGVEQSGGSSGGVKDELLGGLGSQAAAHSPKRVPQTIRPCHCLGCNWHG